MKLYANESELAVLSSCLLRLNESWFSHISRTVKEPVEIFGNLKNKKIYEVVEKLIKEEKNVTIPTIIDRLDMNHSSVYDGDVKSYIDEIYLTPPLSTLEQFNSTLEELDELRKIRKQVRNIEKIINNIKSEENDTYNKEDISSENIARDLQKIVETTDITLGVQTFGDVVKDILSSEQAAWTQTTGIEELDEVLGGSGFESGCLTVVGARPKVGKTVFMNSMVYSTRKNGAYPIVLNYETKDIEFTSKMIARYLADEENGETDSDLHWGLIKRHLAKEEVALTSKQIKLIEKGVEWATNEDWYVSFNKDDYMEEIEALVEKERARREEDAKIILFVDYLGLQVKDAFKEREEITQLTRFYKKLAGKYKISVVCLSQMNRGADDVNDVRALRSSGSIEQDADTIILLDRPHRRDPQQPEYVLEVGAGTTRLAKGGNFELFIDGGTNVIAALDEELRNNNADSSMLTDVFG